jgi:predicted NBD/HSP70 family sugar kinase
MKFFVSCLTSAGAMWDKRAWRGRERAQAVLPEAAETLAIALRSFVHGLAQAVVIVGGELAEA